LGFEIDDPRPLMKPHTEKTILERIIDSVRTDLQRRKAHKAESDIARECRQSSLAPTRGFRSALQQDGVRIIAEVKRASPSKGVFPSRRTPAEQAAEYARAGAACISVVTEPSFFSGSLEMLVEIRRMVDLPLLRKDFIIDPYQLFEARLAGADAILLIAAALEDAQLCDLSAVAESLGLDVLVEVTNSDELERSLRAGARLVGVNNRDLRDFSTDVGRSLVLARRFPPQLTAVSESGIREAAQIARLREAGYRGFLIGEYLMCHDRPAEALRQLMQSDAK
jgi:indole-3-glycerol phosphate synthase